MPGIHHVTAIAGDPARNLNFYTHDLGLRFVKKTVNFDDPSTYHFYFGDTTGSPGTILTFFVWPGAKAGVARRWRSPSDGLPRAVALAGLLDEAAHRKRHRVPSGGDPLRRASPAFF
jgi:catechol 2,3-dioxygenase-like lactoylglutathione lyase family enzyme